MAEHARFSVVDGGYQQEQAECGLDGQDGWRVRQCPRTATASPAPLSVLGTWA
jgi:hypothetical protein